MEDAEYLFRQTEKERKRVGYGARAKKNGSKSKSCKFPSDYLTAAEKKKMNGGVQVYDLSKPMNWDSFKKLPKDLQTTYLKKLAQMGARGVDLVEMFGCPENTFRSYMYNHQKGNAIFTSRKQTPGEEYKKWRKGADEEPDKEVREKTAPAPEAKSFSPAVIPLELQSGTLTFNGDPRAIFEKILMWMDDTKEYSVVVSFAAIGSRGEKAAG